MIFWIIEVLLGLLRLLVLLWLLRLFEFLEFKHCYDDECYFDSSMVIGVVRVSLVQVLHILCSHSLRLSFSPDLIVIPCCD